MKRVEFLGVNATDEERVLFQINFLETRVRELEHIVHRLLKDRVHQEEADAWLDVSGNQKSFTPSLADVRGRGERMAKMIDRWPEAQKWSESDDK